MNPLRTPEDYELFLYTLTEKFPSVRHSTMTFVRRGASLARVTGELLFDQEIRLVVRGISAPEMSFIRPNLTTLIREIDTVIKKVNNDTEQN